ncbi:hypothetical protein B9Z19DRAFT_1064638 [Tuber borchii]|uniref:Uncharacterized protein n=1 Tax=Tuber borchii TaxID=42251 RepID=A0A2T6ZU62_TUBBO|nr:hypothetical protein B9Z19DRAFT_1064638 [Tuber borchii]
MAEEVTSSHHHPYFLRSFRSKLHTLPRVEGQYRYYIKTLAHLVPVMDIKCTACITSFVFLIPPPFPHSFLESSPVEQRTCLGDAFVVNPVLWSSSGQDIAVGRFSAHAGDALGTHPHEPVHYWYTRASIARASVRQLLHRPEANFHTRQAQLEAQAQSQAHAPTPSVPYSSTGYQRYRSISTRLIGYRPFCLTRQSLNPTGSVPLPSMWTILAPHACSVTGQRGPDQDNGGRPNQDDLPTVYGYNTGSRREKELGVFVRRRGGYDLAKRN